MNKLKYFLLFTLLSLICAFYPASAQPAMDSALQQNGKIYVVVAVLVVIFIGIILFLLGMERKISKLERRSRPNS